MAQRDTRHQLSRIVDFQSIPEGGLTIVPAACRELPAILSQTGRSEDAKLLNEELYVAFGGNSERACAWLSQDDISVLIRTKQYTEALVRLNHDHPSGEEGHETH